MKWADRRFAPDALSSTSMADAFRNPQRMRYQPYDELHFIDLPAPVLAFVSGPLGVTMQCADGGLYHLNGDPDDEQTWTVRLVTK